MLSYTSANPVSVTKDGVTQVYDTWKFMPSLSPSLHVNTVAGTIGLTINFSLWGVDPSSNPVELAGSKQTLVVENILTDAGLGTAAAAFFSAVATKAVSTGVIS